MENTQNLRKIILHYHFFKNAGTSIDELLKKNFPSKWVTKEFPMQPALNRQQTFEWIMNYPDAVCYSSHTAILPVPDIVGIKVLPVIFVRHPIDRIASAYSFERKQRSEGFGSVLARNTTLAGYIETRLSIANDRQCRNFHTKRFAQLYPDKEGDEKSRALRAVKALPFVGIVEQFNESLSRLGNWLQQEGFPELELTPIAKNVSRDLSRPIADRIEDLRREIGDAVFLKLEQANADDLDLYRIAIDKAE